MSKSTLQISADQRPSEVKSVLEELIQEGARKMLASAIDA